MRREGAFLFSFCFFEFRRRQQRRGTNSPSKKKKNSYATDETPELMPLTHVLATQLGFKLTEVRKNGTVPWLRPDGKTQVTCEYKKEGE